MSDVMSYIDLLMALINLFSAYVLTRSTMKTKTVVKSSLKLSKKKKKRK